MPALRGIPYAVWRPLMHLIHYVLVVRAIRRGRDSLVVHDCATRPWVRQLIGRAARRAGRPLQLILLDVPADVARIGQHARDRVVPSGSMATHSRRWPVLRELAAADPGRVIPGAETAVILNRREANRLTRITFGPREELMLRRSA